MIARAPRIVLAATIALSFGLLALAQDPIAKPRKVNKTDAEWQKQLSRESYMVTRHAATEPAFSGKLVHNKTKGVYECICCDTPLFTSRTKFDSGTGWPSFYAPVKESNIDYNIDYKLGYARKEVLCNTCGAHLGHVFDDGPAPTGLRYCMNSVSLKFVKDEPAKKPEPEKKAEAGSTTETPK
jgi:peptide-methionine (R)-S-oxide reductase